VVELVKTRVATLADVAEFIRGITFKPNDIEDGPTDTNVDCLRTKNVQTSLDTRDVWAIDPSFVKRPNQYVAEGDILISSANSWNLVGKCCWIPRLARPTAFGGFVTVLRRRDDSVDSRYLFHWFSSDRVQRTIRSFGNQTTNISNLDLKRSASLTLPLPPLDEQRRIAAILDKADELRTQRRQALAHLDVLTQSIFHTMFGEADNLSNLGEYVDFRYGTSNKSGATGIATLRIPNIVSGSIDLADLKVVPVSTDEEKRLLLQDGDLLFVRSNGNPANVGRCAVFDTNRMQLRGDDSRDFIYASYLIRARMRKPGLSSIFLQAYLSSAAGRAKLLAGAKTSAGQYNINTQTLGSLKVPIVKLELQMQYEIAVSAIEQLKDRHSAQLAELDALFASLQHCAFKGEL
jgi:type I restriction enzyme S subunit